MRARILNPRCKWWMGLAVATLVSLAVAPAARAQEPLHAVISPQVIGIDAFYDGAQLLVSGEQPADCDTVVRILGKSGDLRLKKKGKIFGLLWMNLDTLTFTNVPSVYLLYTSKDFRDLVGPAARAAAVGRLGLFSLIDKIRVIPEPPDLEASFNDLIKLKEEEGLYGMKQENFQTLHNEGNVKSFEARLKVPSRLPQGEYTVEVFAVKNGEIVTQSTQPLQVKLEGFPAMLAMLAFQHGAVYGVLATVIALFAGMLMGFIFGGGKGGH